MSFRGPVHHRIVFNIGRFLNMMTPNFQVFAERGSMMLIEYRSLNPAWVEQVADATRQAVKSQ